MAVFLTLAHLPVKERIKNLFEIIERMCAKQLLTVNEKGGSSCDTIAPAILEILKNYLGFGTRVQASVKGVGVQAYIPSVFLQTIRV